MLNDNLLFLDNTNNQIVELSAVTGKQKNVFPVIWPSNKFDIKHDNLIFQTKKKLFVFNL